MKIQIAVNERGFVLRDGVPVEYLATGSHRVSSWFRDVRVEKVSTARLTAELDEQRLKLVPAEDLKLVEVGELQRAVVFHKGVPALWLKAGTHQVWTVDRTLSRETGKGVAQVRVELFDVSGVETKPLRDELKALAPSSDYVETMAPDGAVVLRWVDGKLDAELGAGRHAAWTVANKVQFATIDLKERMLHVTGQEVMTKDRLTLRLNVTAAFKVIDAKRLATVARAPDDVLYLALQLSAREAVAGRTLDELLSSREELGVQLAAAVRSRAEVVGMQLIELGLKDVVLPGDMKELLNKVLQAQKEAEANVILRREETAATRSLAQTAKVLAENPLLVRLKEL
ncbi:MAG: slipin family protein, partial [Myxococcaceae bacterium]|nr:slipin family protein [Myxococcaceae bacterium]